MPPGTVQTYDASFPMRLWPPGVAQQGHPAVSRASGLSGTMNAGQDRAGDLVYGALRFAILGCSSCHLLTNGTFPHPRAGVKTILRRGAHKGHLLARGWRSGGPRSNPGVQAHILRSTVVWKEVSGMIKRMRVFLILAARAWRDAWDCGRDWNW